MAQITIGQLARKVGIRPSAIRYYEAHGVLQRPIRSANDYRLYGPEAVALLRFVRQAKELGLNLDEIRQLIEVSRDQFPCTLTRKLIEHHLVQVEEDLRRLRSLRDRLKHVLRRPPTEAPATVCPLIEDGQRPN